MNKTLYAILGVPEEAGSEVISDAFQAKLESLQDGDEISLTAVREAWNILGNPERRRRYDENLRNTRALARSVAYAEEKESGNRWPAYLLAAVILAGGGWLLAHTSRRTAPAAIQENAASTSLLPAPQQAPLPQHQPAGRAPGR